MADRFELGDGGFAQLVNRLRLAVGEVPSRCRGGKLDNGPGHKSSF